MPPNGSPQAVIFDLDGVLLDTEPLYSEATQAVLDPWEKQFSKRLKREVMGRSATDGAARLLRALGLPLSVEQFLAQREQHLRRLFADCRPLPGAEAWAKTLTAAGIPTGLATSTERELAELKWTSHLFIQSLAPKLCGDDPRIERAKPAPDIYLLAAELLQVPAERCLVFEDSPAGVAAALAAGMRVVHLMNPHVANEDVPFAHHRLSAFSEASLKRFELAAE